MKKIIITLVLISVAFTLSAQNDTGKIASFPFAGSAVNSVEEGEFYAGLFTSQFVSMGYTLVTRTAAIETAMQEINYQSSGMTGEVVEIGKQLSADYVLIGTLGQIAGRHNIRVEVIGVESSEIAASDTQILTSLEQLFDSNLVTQIVARLNMQITGTGGGTAVSSGSTTSMPSLGGLNAVEELRIEYEKANRGQWAGRWIWIGGLAMAAVSPFLYTEYYHNDNSLYFTDFWGLYTLLPVGTALVIAGGITDIVFSVRENRIEETLRRDYGVQMSLTPHIYPTLATNMQTTNWNVGASLKLAL